MRSNHRGVDSGQNTLYLGCRTKKQLIVLSVVLMLVVVVIITGTVIVLLTNKSDPPPPLPSFSPGGDMLDYLVQSGDISRPDGLQATWYHRANKKEEMNKALASDAMILEADVTLEGYGTVSEQPIPIMAHPPDIFSDNTLGQWLDAVLTSRKGIKLDFKTLASVGHSLDLLQQKNSTQEINRPVWLNADVLPGPNTPDFVLPVNGTVFLQLIQERFPVVTLSPGWKVSYGPPLFTESYTRSMVEDMYSLIKDVPQKVTFPVHALLVRKGWQHLSWLLRQSSRFSLTLWQGSIHPNVSDLLFVRDNTHPSRVYYDIYEPTLSLFKEAAGQRSRIRSFYPGGDLMDFLCPDDRVTTSSVCSSLSVHWSPVTDRLSVLAQLKDGSGGMLVCQVSAVVDGGEEGSEAVTLEDLLDLLAQSPDAPWGIYLQVHSLKLLEASLMSLNAAHSSGLLHRPVWITVDGLQSSEQTQFVSRVEKIFPYVTLVLTGQQWPPCLPAAVSSVSQRVVLRLHSALLPEEEQELHAGVQALDRFDVAVEEQSAAQVLNAALRKRAGRPSTTVYVVRGTF